MRGSAISLRPPGERSRSLAFFLEIKNVVFYFRKTRLVLCCNHDVTAKPNGLCPLQVPRAFGGQGSRERNARLTSGCRRRSERAATNAQARGSRARTTAVETEAGKFSCLQAIEIPQNGETISALEVR